MLTRLVEDVRRAPERINYKREELSFRARQNLHTACGLTNERLFDARISVISQVASLLDRVDELPVIKRVTGPAHTRAAEYLADATSPVIEDYDNLNARAVNNALAELTRLQKWLSMAPSARTEPRDWRWITPTGLPAEIPLATTGSRRYVFDLGCGAGFVSRVLRQVLDSTGNQGTTIVGCDMVPQPHYPRGPGFEFVLGDYFELMASGRIKKEDTLMVWCSPSCKPYSRCTYLNKGKSTWGEAGDRHHQT